MTPANTKENIMPGPAVVAVATPIKTKIPAPIIEPMPSIVRSVAVRQRFNVEDGCVVAVELLDILLNVVYLIVKVINLY